MAVHQVTTQAPTVIRVIRTNLLRSYSKGWIDVMPKSTMRLFKASFIGYHEITWVSGAFHSAQNSINFGLEYLGPT